MSIYCYYVYAYIRSKDSKTAKAGTPYYIGKGKGKRAWSKQHRISIPSDSSFIVILENNLSNVGALALERRYIKWYGRVDNNTGILRNLTDGGDGTDPTIAKNWVWLAKERGNFNPMKTVATRKKNNSYVSGSKKAKETQIKSNKPFWTEESHAKGVATRKKNNSYKNSQESIDKMVATRTLLGHNLRASMRCTMAYNTEYHYKIRLLKDQLKNALKLKKVMPGHSQTAKTLICNYNIGMINYILKLGDEINDKNVYKYKKLILTLPQYWHTQKEEYLISIITKLEYYIRLTQQYILQNEYLLP